MGKARVRPAHILRMCNRLSKKFPELDFTNIVTIDFDALQTRFESDETDTKMAGCFRPSNDTIYVGLRKVCEYFPFNSFENAAKTLLHEVIHRYTYSIHGNGIEGHGLEFQEACLKFGLDPRREIEHDKAVELMVEVPYEPSAFMSAGGMEMNDYQDWYEREDVTDEVYLASKAIYRRGHQSIKDTWTEENDFLENVRDVYHHQYYQHYPSYRLCKHIVSNYYVLRDTKLRDLQEKTIREAREAA